MHSHVVLGLAAAVVAVFGVEALSAPQAAVRAPGPAPAFDTLFSRWTASTPGCAVGVMRDGALVFASGYGMADLASSVPLDQRSILGVASLSKHFTAYAVARLVAAGRLSANDDVRRFIPELPDYGSPIRVVHLLNHTSGLRDYLSMIGLAGRNAEGRVSRAGVLDLLARQRGLNNAPGAAHVYSNTNYYLLALIVERVTRQPFAAYMRDSVFQPLGMTDTRFALDGEVPRRQAESYRMNDSGRLEQVALGGMLFGEGGAYSTVADMARWEQHLRRPPAEANGVVRLFRENGRYADGRAIDYGWGTQFATYRGVAIETHGGTWGGFRSYYLRMPSLGFAATVLCNQLEISPFQLTRRLADVAIGDRLGPAEATVLPPVMPPSPPQAPGPKIPRAAVTALLGEYHSPELDARYVLTHEGERLQLRVGAQDAVPVAVVHADTLSAASRQMVVERDGAERVTGFVLNSGRVRGVRLVRVLQSSSGPIRLRYLGTSGWWLRTPEGSVVVDHVGLDSTRTTLGPSLVALRPSELGPAPAAIVVTHQHPDHFSPSLFAWADSVPRRVIASGGAVPLRQGDLRLEPRTAIDVGPARLWTIRSTDEGVGVLARIGGVTIFHAGDHARWNAATDSAYRAEIDHLAGLAIPVDIALVPVATGVRCQSNESLRDGALYAIERLRPRVTLPMHVRCVPRMAEVYESFRVDAVARGAVVVIPRAVGDEFEYVAGALTPVARTSAPIHAGAVAADTLDVARATTTPVLDGRVDDREYGPPALRIPTAAGDVRVWVARRDDHVYIAADLPDSTFYWGDDLVVSLDPLGRGGPAPDSGDRQWYLRRVLDSSVVMTAVAGQWYAPGRLPPTLGATRQHADWSVASTSSERGWMVELRVRAVVVKPGAAAPRLALRTYNDRPSGWWSWPAPPNGLPAQRVERNPALWVPLRLP